VTEALKTKPKTKAKLRIKWVQAAIGVALLGLAVGLGAWLNSDSFRERVRVRVMSELETITGGRVELESLTWNLSQLRVEAHGLTIHGLEPPAEAPYVHADRVVLRLKIVSFFSRKIALREVITDGLTVHLIVNPNGTTNQPAPKHGTAEGFSTEKLFDLAAGRVEVNGGALILNQKRMPFDFQGEQVSIAMNYSHAEQGYEGSVGLSVVSARGRSQSPVRGQVDAHFLLRENAGEIKSLKITSGHSVLEASGSVRNYNHPSATLEYSLALDLPEAGKLAGVNQIRAGRADVKGRLSWQNGQYSSEGNLTLQGVDWHDTSLRVTGLDAASPFALTPEKILLSRIAARVLGGTVQGEAQVLNWNASADARKTAQQKGTAVLHVSRLEIGHVAAAISTASFPVDKVNAAGAVSGEIKASWSGSLRNSVADINLDVAPPENPSPHQVPVSAQLRSTYHGDIRTLDVAALSLSTRAIHVNASGKLGSRSAQARLAVNAGSLRELQPALDALRPGTRIPLWVNGRASFNGSVSGELDALSARGHVEMDDFDTEMAATRPGGAAQAPQRVHWDSLTGDLAYSPASVSVQHGVLHRGRAQVGFNVTAGLVHGSFDENLSQLVLDLRLANAGLEDMQAVAGLSYPVTGVMNADLHATGTLRTLRGAGNLQVSKLTVAGEPFQSFRGQLLLAPQEVQLNNIVATHARAQLTGSVAYNMGQQGVRFDLTGTNVDLATLRRLQTGQLSLQGKAEFHLTGAVSGRDGAGAPPPAINGSLQVSDLVVNHAPAGNITLSAETHGSTLALKGRSEFEGANVDLSGTVDLHGDFPGQLALKFSNIDFNPLLQPYMQADLSSHSSIVGTVEVRGPMKRPRELSLTGNVSHLHISLDKLSLLNDGPIRFAMDHEALRAEQFRLVGPDTDLLLRGSIGIAGDHALDLHGTGHLDLKLAQQFNTDIQASGMVNFGMDLAGTVQRPQMSGRLTLTDASAAFTDLPNGLSHITGSMLFAQDRIQIEKLTAQSGGGQLNLGGFLAYRNGLFFDLTAAGKDVRLRYPPGVSSSADATLHYSGSAKSSLLTGDISIIRFNLSRQFDIGQALGKSNKAPVISTMNPFLENLRLDVHIASAQELSVETSMAKLTGNLDLHARGTAARPAILGRVTLAEGDVRFNGSKYRLERGDITFSNPLVIEPTVNIEMSTRVQTYDITIGLHGTLSGGRGLTLTYRSDPPLSNSEIIALLAFGRSQEQDIASASQPGQTSTPTASSASSAVLGEAMSAAVSNRAERLFGGSRVTFNPQFIESTGNNTTTRVTVEQQINNNVTFTYGTSFTQSTETLIRLEYAIDKDWSIVAVRDQNGVLSFDVSLRRRRK
jgi:translocation and assembly module TamB